MADGENPTDARGELWAVLERLDARAAALRAKDAPAVTIAIGPPQAAPAGAAPDSRPANNRVADILKDMRGRLAEIEKQPKPKPPFWTRLFN